MADEKKTLTKVDKWFWIFYGSRLLALGIAIALFFPIIQYWSILCGIILVIEASYLTYLITSKNKEIGDD